MEATSNTQNPLAKFGILLDQLPPWARTGEQSRLPHAIADYFASNGVTARERRMLEFINQITDKPEWERKVYDEAIVSNWRREAVRFDPGLPEKGDFWLSEIMFECCMKELREKADIYKETGIIAVLDVEATIVKSDIAISTELRDALRSAVHPLEDVPEQEKDWHPQSDEKVLDLLHPSLFPVV